MAKLFSPEGKIYQLMSRFTDMLKLNVLWLVFSLPLITIGASTIAAYTITLRMVEDTEGYIARSFFRAFRDNLKQGIPMSFIAAFAAWAVYLNFEFWGATESAFFLVSGVITAYIAAFSLLYAFPLLARYENTIFKTMVNSMRISMKYFFRSLLIVFLVALEIGLILWSTATFFVGLLIGPACIILTVSGPSMWIFKEIDRANQEEA